VINIKRIVVISNVTHIPVPATSAASLGRFIIPYPTIMQYRMNAICLFVRKLFIYIPPHESYI
jgi:hypothetical protein